MQLIFRKIRTAKNRERLNPLTLSSSGAIRLKTTLAKYIFVKRMHFAWVLYLQTPDDKTGYMSNALTLSYRASCLFAKKILYWFANNLFREYREMTTPSRIFVPGNLSYCRV